MILVTKDINLRLKADTLGLTAAKRGCGVGTCGTCTCHVDGQAVMSCLVPVETVNGSAVRTLEGVAKADGTGVERKTMPAARARRRPGSPARR